MDIVYITDLKIDTTIGVYEWERAIKQTLRFDLEMSHDISVAAQSDNVEDALDYFTVSQRVTEFVEQSSFQLIETLAEKVAGIILEEFPTNQVKMKLSKAGAVKNAKDVGLIIVRNKA